MFAHRDSLSFESLSFFPGMIFNLILGNGTSLLALEMSPRLWKASSQVTAKPLLKRELAFYSFERDLSPNVNNARYMYK